MSRKAILITASALILTGVVGLVFALLFSRSLDGGAAVSPGGAARGPMGMGRDSDAMFIRQMIPHHDDAIAMADIALTRAEHPEVRRLAEVIRRTQTAENAQMREWYRLWFGSEVPANGAGMMGRMSADGAEQLEELDRDESFDKAFLEEMIPHHEMALMMARMAGRSTSRDEMREFTQMIIAVQSREIRQMEEWYGQWYR